MTSPQQVKEPAEKKNDDQKTPDDDHKLPGDDYKPSDISRGMWGSKAEFVLSCVGLSVGIGNVWRFPYLAYQNGGGAFLMAYIILLILVGKPLYFMELAIGQFCSLGPLAMWSCFPAGRGIGAAMVIMCLMVAIYYNVVMTYTLYFIGQSFRKVLPWSGCFEWWGADSNCYVRTANQSLCPDALDRLAFHSLANSSATWLPAADRYVNVTARNGSTAAVPEKEYYDTLSSCSNATQTASEQFWDRYVLSITSGIDDMGVVKWDLAVSLLVCWFVVFLGLMKGIKSSGKVVYFTATFPYVILVILLGYGASLDGAVDGIKYYFIPSWEKVLDVMVWRKAAEQLLYSLSIGWGSLIMYASYNKFDNKIYRDAVFVSSLDFFTSLVSGVVIFSVLGNLAKEMQMDIDVVVKVGQGLAFVAYPEALARLVVPQLWSVLFFFMLFLLAVDSQFSYLETVFTAVYDAFPTTRRHKVAVTGIVCSVCFLLGLPCVTEGGQYVLNLMDTYGGGYAGLFVASAELLAIMWGYGISNFCNDLELMLGFRPGIYWRVCWAFVSPVVLLFLLIYSLVKHSVITYNDKPYPMWAERLGWGLVAISVVQIPLWAIVVMCSKYKNIREAFRPSPEWGPSDPQVREHYKRITSPAIEINNLNSEVPNGHVNQAMDIRSEYV